jgi:hypothetical protein
VVAPWREEIEMGFSYYMRDADGTITPTSDVITWGRWMEANESNRRIRQTTIGDSWISTVFTGINHNLIAYTRDVPVIYETMVFGGPLDDTCARYATEEEAIAGHEAIVESITTEYEREQMNALLEGESDGLSADM